MPPQKISLAIFLRNGELDLSKASQVENYNSIENGFNICFANLTLSINILSKALLCLVKNNVTSGGGQTWTMDLCVEIVRSPCLLYQLEF